MIKRFFEENITVRIIAGILSVFILFLGIFLIYESPEKYVLNEKGEVYHDANGQPIVYHTDLFGKTFYKDNGIRVYSAVPDYMSSEPIN